VAGPGAKLIWSADLDPGTIEVEALPSRYGAADAIDPAQFARWLSIAGGADSREYSVISDGYRRIRLDVVGGSLRKGPVVLRYHLEGISALRPRVLPLRRLLAICTHRRFIASLFPPDPKMARLTDMLRVHDGLAEGASLAELCEALYGEARGQGCPAQGSDSLRSRVRRLAREARAMAAGGYRQLMKKGAGG
jgi:hypothetical protein